MGTAKVVGDGEYVLAKSCRKKQRERSLWGSRRARWSGRKRRFFGGAEDSGVRTLDRRGYEDDDVPPVL